MLGPEALADFIRRDKQDRYRTLLRSSKGRQKLTARLDHAPDFDQRFLRQVPNAQQNANAIERLLTAAGARDVCYVLSTNPRLTERSMELAEALEATVGVGFGTFILCVEAVLGYYEGEDPGCRYIVTRVRGR